MIMGRDNPAPEFPKRGEKRQLRDFPREYPMPTLISIRCIRAGLLALVAMAGVAPAARSPPERVALTPVQRANARIETLALDATQKAPSSGIALTGRVEAASADERNVVTAPAAGRVVSVQSPPGSALKSGQAIAVIEGPEVAALQRNAREVRAAATASQQRLERERTLLAEGVISPSRVEQAQAAHASALAQLRQATSALPGIDLTGRDGELIVRAPAGGTLAGPRLLPDQRIEAGDSLARIGTRRRLRLALVASAAAARALAAGDPVIVRGRSCEARAVVRAVGVAVDANQVVPVDGEIAEDDACLLPGEAVTAYVSPRSAAAGGWALPPRAFVRRGAETFVFVEREGAFEVVQVEPEAALAGYGRSPALRAGDRVAISGTALLKGAWIGIAEE